MRINPLNIGWREERLIETDLDIIGIPSSRKKCY
jgi:hypothetical protein